MSPRSTTESVRPSVREIFTRVESSVFTHSFVFDSVASFSTALNPVSKLTSGCSGSMTSCLGREREREEKRVGPEVEDENQN